MTLPATTPLWFRHDMGSAPVLRGVAGDAITLLDACLVNGFNSRTATSVVVASNVATVTFSSAFGWLVNQVVEIAGATPAGLNGWKRVTAVSGNTLTFPAPGVSNQTATGTITCKTPGLGWQKAFTGTNIAAYRAQDISGTRLYLRVADDGTGSAAYARIRGFETMSDVNTGTGPFPTDAQLSGGLYLHKSSTADTVSRQWALVGDHSTWYASVRCAATTQAIESGFGDFSSFMGSDAYRCFVFASDSASAGLARGVMANIGPVFYPRGSSQLGGSIAGVIFNDGTENLEFPNSPNNGLILSPRVILETATRARGVFRGMQLSRHGFNTSGIFALGQALSSSDGYGGVGVCLDAGSGSGLFRLGAVFDAVGPW